MASSLTISLIPRTRGKVETCQLGGCNLQCDIAKNDDPRLFYTEALQQALAKDAELKVAFQCGHAVIPQCSTCSNNSRMPERNSAGDATPRQQSQQPDDNDSAITEGSVSDSSDSGRDTPVEDTPRIEEKPEDGAIANKKDTNLVFWFPYRNREAASPRETDEQQQPSTEIVKPEQKTAESTEVPANPEEGTAPFNESKKDRTDIKNPGLDFTQVSESACLPIPHDGASATQRKKLTKDAKAQRAAALKQQREERKKAHEEEIQDIMDEISHQREVLRSRRDQKKQRQKLRELQTKLERLCKKELDDSDYATTDDESEEEQEDDNQETNNSSSSSGENEDDSPKDDDGDKTSEEQASPATEEDDSKPQSAGEDTNAWAIPTSKAKQVWEEQKSTKEEENNNLDKMMEMIGLESVKAKMLEIKTLVDTARRQDVDLNKERFNVVLKGNPGTGKTTFARMLGGFLSSLGLVEDQYTKTSGSKLVYDGINEVRTVLSSQLPDSKGVVFVDDAHLLRPNQSGTGRKVLDYIVTKMDEMQGDIIFIFAGYGKEMETFLTHNQSLESRIPFTIDFDDYENVELLQILEKKINDKFNSKMKVDKGMHGVYMRMAARRIGRGRGVPSFGNAREVQNTLLRILFRQASRLEEARKRGEEPDDLFLTMEDIVGPPPSTALENSKAWQGLQKMVGLKSVKDSLKSFVYRLQVNYDREIAEKPIVDCSLNRIFLGNPGTGKTSVAKYYGQIMVDIGLLSNGEVVIKNPADFVGEYLGESENNTKRILASTRGKVLIIDEAYALSERSDPTFTGSGNFYKTAVVDTLVANVQGTANEDRCILLLGYRDRMERMFQHVNPGFTRRFPMSSAFEFEDFSDEELRQILDMKLKEQAFTATDEAKKVAMEVLSRARSHLNFGNAGEIDILLTRAKEMQQSRHAAQTEEYDPFLLEREDFDIDFDRTNDASTRIKDLFKDFVGAEDIIEKLLGYSRIVQNTKALDMDPRSQIPFNYLFRGPPGKTSQKICKKLTLNQTLTIMFRYGEDDNCT